MEFNGIFVSKKISKYEVCHYDRTADTKTKFFLKQISEHRYNDFFRQIENLLDAVENDTIAEVLNDVSGFDMNFV
ncbi:MAG: hypothetical protein J5976_04775 [Bacteroidales bacterium]|nr:hypothetical protein [Bacteroidales bacterium]